MIRFAFSIVLIIHAILHLIGFAKAWGLSIGSVLQGKTLFHLSEQALKSTGILWLLTTLIFIFTIANYYLHKEWWWVAAVAGILLSQALIIIYWQDAKWGSVVNIIVLIAVMLTLGENKFKRQTKGEVDNLHRSAQKKDRVTVTEAMLLKVPSTIQHWLKKSQIVGTTIPTFVYIKQEGMLRTTPDGAWMPFNAEQTFTIDPPGFVWSANIHTNFSMDIVGRDQYQNGKGHMLIKAASILPVANSSGPEIDEGTMIRYMAEMAWFPQAALSNYVHWEEIDSAHTKLTMNYKGISASGIYTFNTEGMPIAFEAQRFREDKGKFTKDLWSIMNTGYKKFNGVPIGYSSEVTWKLKAGDFTWLKLTITDIKYY
jgi:hypothetical protein